MINFIFFFKNIFLNIYVNSPVFMKLGGWIISFVGVKPKYILLCSSYRLITCSCNTKIYNCLPQQDKHWNTKTKIRNRMSTRHSYFNYSQNQITWNRKTTLKHYFSVFDAYTKEIVFPVSY